VEIRAVLLERPLTEAETEALLRQLPPQRRERLLRLQVREKWREPLCAYRLLGRLLGERYGWEQLPEIALTEQGKPFFPDFPYIHFSISHTEGAVLAAVAEYPVGVDIERIRPVRPEVLQRFGAENEDGFFRLWVRREARGKCSGAGVGGMLRSELPLQAGEAYAELELFSGYAAGAAARNGPLQTVVRQVTLEEIL